VPYRKYNKNIRRIADISQFPAATDLPSQPTTGHSSRLSQWKNGVTSERKGLSYIIAIRVAYSGYVILNDCDSMYSAITEQLQRYCRDPEYEITKAK